MNNMEQAALALNRATELDPKAVHNIEDVNCEQLTSPISYRAQEENLFVGSSSDDDFTPQRLRSSEDTTLDI